MTFSYAPSAIYRLLRWLRWVLPISLCALALSYEIIELWPPDPEDIHLIPETLVYAFLGPACLWLIFTWLVRQVHERDEAEAYLGRLYHLTREVATILDVEALVDIAVRMPEQLLGPVSTSLILRDHPEGSWRLAGTHNLAANDPAALQASLMAAGLRLDCSHCLGLTAVAHQHCPLLSPLSDDFRYTHSSVMCLSLSKDHPQDALLAVYLGPYIAIPPVARQTLESMATNLAVALDHARLQARQTQMLHELEHAVREPSGLTTTVEHILANIASMHYADKALVFLSSPDNEIRNLNPIAVWPAGAAHASLSATAQRALHERNILVTDLSADNEQVIAVPLVVDGVTVGALMLVGQVSFTPTSSQAALLDAAAGLIALTIRNSQLYAELESEIILEERGRLAREVHDGLAQSLGFLNMKVQHVDRLLARGDQKAARQALHELHNGVQEIYSEVRATLQDLRWLRASDEGLERQLQRYGTVFSSRTGLNVSVDVDVSQGLNYQPQSGVQLFRIVQEALTNVHRHAQAQQAWVRLRADMEGICLEVEDDGVGLDLPDVNSQLPGHLGLCIIRERVESMGGRLSIESVPGHGTKLHVAVPAVQARVMAG